MIKSTVCTTPQQFSGIKKQSGGGETSSRQRDIGPRFLLRIQLYSRREKKPRYDYVHNAIRASRSSNGREESLPKSRGIMIPPLPSLPSCIRRDSVRFLHLAYREQQRLKSWASGSCVPSRSSCSRRSPGAVCTMESAAHQTEQSEDY